MTNKNLTCSYHLKKFIEKFISCNSQLKIDMSEFFLSTLIFDMFILISVKLFKYQFKLGKRVFFTMVKFFLI